MKGADVLLDTLSKAGVEVIFANPGTSEMHLVAALDKVQEVRAVLALFEGVATGAADGYARIAGKPAAVLLHLGPGLGNGLANLHNARRAGVPVVVVVGDHARSHEKFDAPLQSDIAGMARTVSGWVHRTGNTDELAADASSAVRAATGSPSQVATLIVPADVSWSEATELAAPAVVAPDVHAEGPASEDAIAQAVAALAAGASVRLLLGGEAVREPALSAAGRIADASGATLLCETFPTRWERGAGVPKVERLAYFGDDARKQLTGVTHLILIGSRSPFTFFAYPDRESNLVPDGCQVLNVQVSDLPALADRVAPNITAKVQLPAAPVDPPDDTFNAAKIAAIVAAQLPEGAIVVDESTTAGAPLLAATQGAPRHDWLTLTGGSIGYGLPAATGAAIAAPDRQVLCLQADGSAMYTISALWTQAREKLNVTTVIYNNGSYDILWLEYKNVGIPMPPGQKAQSLLGISNPRLDFVAIATGMGVHASRVSTAEEFAEALKLALAQPGPHLIDATIKSIPEQFAATQPSPPA